MTHFQRTAAWLAACGLEPCNSVHLSTQLACHVEEICELLTHLRVDSDGWQRVLERAVTDLNDLAMETKAGKRTMHFAGHMREAVLDALCDAEVTGNGVAYLAGFDKDGADQAVLASNDAKLIDGKAQFHPGGKIMKPKGWQPPDLRPFACQELLPLFKEPTNA